jgi:hypothetical protein
MSTMVIWGKYSHYIADTVTTVQTKGQPI